ncbi:hypothetical protein [Mailhella sp.]
MKPITEVMLNDRLEEARAKHPARDKDLNFALSVLRLELGELEHAMRYETDARVYDEALDVAAVALRIAEGDWK